MPWKAFVDGGSRGNPGPAGAGVQVFDAEGRSVFEAGFFLGRMTNNQAEYRGLLAALDALERAGATDVLIISDSQLMVRQILGEYRVKSADLRPLYEEASHRLRGFERWHMRHVLREENTRADALANQAMDHGADVITRDQLSGAEGSSPAAPPVAAPPTPPPAAPARVQVTVVDAPNSGACPAGMEHGERFIFEAATPAGVCLRACSAVIPAVRELQQPGPAASRKVRCGRQGCGAVFEVARAPRARGD